MKKPSRLLRGCALAGILILIVLGIGGAAWWFFRSQIPAGGGPPSSPVQVFLLSPSSGDEVAAGDFVSIALQASAPAGITSAELFVDGESLGAVSDMPESAAWTWQAWPAGVHTLSARATAGDGEVGESQTVILNVMLASHTIDVLAGPGQTLAEVGGPFGVPPDQMAGANPHQNPSKPLVDGQPVHVPTDGAAPVPPGGGGPGGGVPFSIVWELKITKPADKSYCYLSDGSGVWDKVPKPPFNFFESLDNLYTQLFDALPQQEIVLQAQCWGWVGGALEFLGDGQTTFNINQARGQLAMNGQGFQFTGTPQWPPDVVLLEGEIVIPPPYGLREPANPDDCLAHGGSAAVCGPSMNAISEIVLEWEWQAGLLFPSDPAANINGYQLYQINPVNNTKKYMKEVNPAAARAAALPLAWGSPCYGVQAYAEGPQYGGIIFSDMATYCPGQPPATQKVIEAPSDWLTSGGEWIELDCSVDIPGWSFGSQPAVMVGRYIREYDSGCYSESSYSGGVMFPLNSLPSGAVIQKASFKFSRLFIEWGAAGVALEPAPQTCVAAVGTSKQDWSGLNTGDHTSKTELSGGAFFTPLTSIAAWATPDLDVTGVVKIWLNSPQNNHGFILIPIAAPDPDDGVGKCLSALDTFQLEIEFFAP